MNTMPSSPKPDIISILRDIYPDISIQLKNIEYNGLISLFVVKVDSSEELDNHWNKISGTVASYYQSFLDNDYEKWNIYMLYISSAEIDPGIKYRIENDRFSSRKIVIDNYADEINDINIETLIIQNITNKDLVLPVAPKDSQRKIYQSDSVIWGLIKDGKIKPGKGSTQEAESLLEKVSTKLKA